MSAVTGREATEFKGALDAMFAAQRKRTPAEADDNVAEEAKKAKAAAEAKKKAEEDRKRKAKEEAKSQDKDPKKPKHEEVDSNLATTTCVNDPRKNLDFVVCEMESPKVTVGVRGGQVILASAEATNKKVPKDTVLVSWTSEVGCKTDVENTKEWNVNWKTEVL